jgi:transcription initiation factor TFIID subunit 2
MNHFHMLCTNFFCDFQTIPSAMANLRNIHAICPPEVFEFIMGLFKYNDNSRNKVCI